MGTAQLKLEALENHCDIREIIEVTLESRKTSNHKTNLSKNLYMCFLGNGWA